MVQSLEFLQSNPYTIRVENDASGAETIKQFLKQETLSRNEAWTHLSMTVGDAIHNMRSALDHIAFAVARKRRLSSKLLVKVQFLITSSREEFRRKIKQGKVDQIGADWIEFMRSKQPYHRRNGKRLLRLSKLDNMDKHRELLSLAPIAQVGIRLGDHAPLDLSVVPFEKGIEVSPLKAQSYFKVIAPYITLANSIPYDERREARWELLDLRGVVASIIKEANAKFFS